MRHEGTDMNTLHLKHLLVTSPIGRPLLTMRRFVQGYRSLLHPELALLWREDRMMEAIVSRLLERDSVCIDVGAHIGSMTHLFRTLAPKGRHVAIEAIPTKAAWLRKRFADIDVKDVAISDEEGEVTFFENLDRPGFSSLGARSGRNREVAVTCTTLDKLLAARDRVDLIKIDVEGFELNVVRGAREVLKRCRPVLIFEAGAASDPNIDNSSYVELLDLLTRDLGYEVRPVFGDYYGKAPITRTEFLSCRTYPFLAFNYVARPIDSAG